MLYVLDPFVYRKVSVVSPGLSRWDAIFVVLYGPFSGGTHPASPWSIASLKCPASLIVWSVLPHRLRPSARAQGAAHALAGGLCAVAPQRAQTIRTDGFRRPIFTVVHTFSFTDFHHRTRRSSQGRYLGLFDVFPLRFFVLVISVFVVAPPWLCSYVLASSASCIGMREAVSYDRADRH